MQMTTKSKKILLELGQIILAAFIGDMTAMAFINAGYLKGDLMIGLGTISSIVLWFIYIDFLKWVAKKVPNEKKQKEPEVGDKATH